MWRSVLAETAVFGVLQDPVQVPGHSGVHSRISRPSAPVSPGNHAYELVLFVRPFRHQGTTTVSLKNIFF